MVFKLSAEVFLNILKDNYSYLLCDAITDSDEFLNPLSTWLQCKTLRISMKETLAGSCYVYENSTTYLTSAELRRASDNLFTRLGTMLYTARNPTVFE